MRRFVWFASLLVAASVHSQDSSQYDAKIREFTTEPFFLTPLVEHLPPSSKIPDPASFLGHIVGAPNVLDYSADINKYMRALEKASPRVRVISMGTSEEGREMTLVLISDAENLERINRIASLNATLGDPRKLGPDPKPDPLIQETLPIYWATGGMHAPETGPPEMLMELAYRLAASEDPYIKEIRKNEVVMLTPVLDVDGRERVVDLYRYKKANKDKPAIPLVYWGHYVAHDDNRDALTFRLSLSQAMMRMWLRFHPTVLHDLHESVPLLYISTGTGPYNAWLDPLVISEWQQMAYDEIQQLTAFGVPGVWTHGYYDGWSASYGFYVANGHNGIGRFYETFSAGGADTGVRSTGGSSGRDWYRPSPPPPKVRWSIRDNVNLSESGLLMGMHRVAVDKEKFLRSYFLKSQRSVAKAITEGPVAYVLPPQPATSKYRVDDLLAVMERQGVEVHHLSSSTTTKNGTFAAGSIVIRMDQPYSRMADMMLDQQYYKPSDPENYDDTGWQLGPLYDLPVVRCTDQAILKSAMTIHPPMPVASGPSVGGSRIALVHTWSSTQDEGWARLALEGMSTPYTYVSVHELRDNSDLKAKYDVILIPQTGGTAQSIVNGISNVDSPLPWKATKDYPNLGGPDSSNDIRGGIELQGMVHLQRFVREGGMLICVGNTCKIPIEYGLVPGVTAGTGGQLRAPGGVYGTVIADKRSLVTVGYGDTLGVYFNSFSCPILNVAGGGPRGRGASSAGGRSSGRGSLTDPDIIQGRPPYTPKELPGDTPERSRPDSGTPPKVLLRFAVADKLLISGMIDHADDLAGKPALLDCSVGKGHILLFAFNPFWRGETVGSYALVLNAARNWNLIPVEKKPAAPLPSDSED